MASYYSTSYSTKTTNTSTGTVNACPAAGCSALIFVFFTQASFVFAPPNILLDGSLFTLDVMNSLSEKKQVALLVLPEDEMIGKSQRKNSTDSQLVMMQLPASLSFRDFQKAGNCKFLASNATSSMLPPQSCCLIVESQGSAFDLFKVETSNALVMFPSPQFPPNDEHKHKKPKTDAQTKVIQQLCSMSCRLLQAGGSGSSFLELRPKPLCLKSLRRLLQPHLFDPYNRSNVDTSAWQGRTVASLAYELLLSQAQIVEGLERLKALALFKNLDAGGQCCYGVLSEEAILDAQCALLSTLAECSEFEKYAFAEIPLEPFVHESMKRMSETYPYLDQVLRHCIQTMLLLPMENDHLNPNGRKHSPELHVKLDIKKVIQWRRRRLLLTMLVCVLKVSLNLTYSLMQVAICVAKQLFLKRTEPFDEQSLLSCWQSRLPGVGDDYHVSLDLLRGVAIRCDTGKRWKYFETHQLPLEPEERFRDLFQEQGIWSLEDLKPYLQPLVEETNLTPAELLHQYAKVVNKETQIGEIVQFYTRL